MGKCFDPERGLWSLLSTLVDICGLSLLWALLCLPVVTIGPATAALYYPVVKAVRRKDREAFHAFFHSFRQNLRTGIPATLLWAAALALLASWLMRGGRHSLLISAFIVMLAVGLLALGVEFFLDRFLRGSWAPGWSLVVMAVSVGLSIPLLVVRFVPSLREEVRRRFHM